MSAVFHSRAVEGSRPSRLHEMCFCFSECLGFSLFTEVEGANDGSTVLLTSGTEVRHRFADYNIGKEVPPNFAEGGVCDWTDRETAVLW
jgi:hypothetical protein